MSDQLQDRLDIEKAMRHYAVGLDERRWAEWDLEIVRVSGGSSYEDTLVRTADGWRITERKVFMKWKQTFTVEDEVTRG